MIEPMMFHAPPKPPQHTPQRPPGHDPEDDGGESPVFDDAVAELPDLDGDATSEAHELDGGEGAPSEVQDALLGDDTADEADAELAAEAMIDTLQDVETTSWETAEDEPLEADQELAEGEGESWADDRIDESALAEDELDNDLATPEDGGEEGFDDDLMSDLDLPTRPEGARPSEKSEEDESDIPGLDEWRP